MSAPSGDERELYEVQDLYLGRRWLIVAEGRAHAAWRASALHRGSVGLEVVDHVDAPVTVSLDGEWVRWVVGVRLERPPDIAECPRDFVRIRHLGTLPEPWSGPPLTEWEGTEALSDEGRVAEALMGPGWEPVDPDAADPPRRSLRPLRPIDRQQHRW